ncbi:MAG: hypothetical protein IJ439_03730 [Tyzzerella sp.]|nr:hypothetical protein [Tyzzerella sp.]
MSIDYSDMAFPKKPWKQKESKKTPWKQKKKPVKKTAPAKKRKKRRYKKVPSIMQDKDDKRCYLCMLLEDNYRIHSYTEEHHVLFGDTKWISDAYGLRVNLCVEHHRAGRDAVHNNNKIAKLLMKIAQRKFTETYPELEWMKIVQENYL